MTRVEQLLGTRRARLRGEPGTSSARTVAVLLWLSSAT